MIDIGKETIKKFLKDNGYLPLSQWSLFEVKHGNKKDSERVLQHIKNNVGHRSGLYLYQKGRRLLYIGKAKPLYDRLKSHYLESYRPVSGDRKRKQTFHNFFSAKRNRGRLMVYWIEVGIEEERVILEAMLQYILKPEFE